LTAPAEIPSPPEAPAITPADSVEELWARSPWNGTVSSRTLNTLRRHAVLTVGDLTSRTAADLTDLRRFGARGLEEVQRVLAPHGLSLAGDSAAETLRAAAKLLHEGRRPDSLFFAAAVGDLLEAFAGCGCGEGDDHWREKRAALRAARAVLAGTEGAEP
jgi:Bacterial RNA polymerase, alpha chain C terminal domain